MEEIFDMKIPRYEPWTYFQLHTTSGLLSNFDLLRSALVATDGPRVRDTALTSVVDLRLPKSHNFRPVLSSFPEPHSREHTANRLYKLRHHREADDIHGL